MTSSNHDVESLGKPPAVINDKTFEHDAQSMHEGTNTPAKNEQTHRGFKSRHSQMIALGGAIGTSLFIGTALVLRTGGPLFLLLAYMFLCLVTYGVMTGIAEIASYLPVPGGTMSYYGHKYVSSSMGFALGYLYWYSLGILVPYELTAVALLIEYWSPGVNPAVWMTILLVIIVVLNFLPVHLFGEVEFWGASTKLLLIIGLMILSLVLCFGGGPDGRLLGFTYWNNPGATNTYILEGDTGRFLALLRCFALASFAFVLAPEYLIVTAGEMQSPRQNLPKAARRYVWRLILLFIPLMICIGIVCPYDDPQLTLAGTARSPFIIAAKNAGIPVLDSVITAAIIMSASTAGNAFLYQASRNLYSLAISGAAPSIFKRCDKRGVPYYAIGASASLSLLAYLSLSSSTLTVFNWFINITNSSGYISWMCCTLIYNRFRKACKVHEVESPYRPRIQPFGIYFSGVSSFILLLLNGFHIFFPSEWTVGDFISAYIGIPVFLILYLGHKLVRRNESWIRPTSEIDMLDGMEEVLAAERPTPVLKGLGRLRMIWE
ncbi:AAT family amino acid transporter [Fusarium austroafricanum]|uniref:AAT family amino acid transporter n=1 Tax=Fusarium austroafricanum TaxID=2364996 RepID=A0A8H4NLY9_9HYPO|nr:AAT family amino acid transporter [Fusarium austroafricanum]